MSEGKSLNLSEEAVRRHEEIKSFSQENHDFFYSEYKEEIDFIEKIEFALCWLNCVLGSISPSDSCDESIRDLFADTFDSFLASKRVMLDGFLTQPFPLLRRAYESMMLIRYFMIKPEEEPRWRNGGKKGKITPEDTRNIGVGDEDYLSKMYDYYCVGTHVNSKYIWMRQLGNSNTFTFGNKITNIHSLITKEYIMRHIQLLSFFRFIVFSHYEKKIADCEPELIQFLENVSDEKATEINLALNEEFEKLRVEYAKEHGIELED